MEQRVALHSILTNRNKDYRWEEALALNHNRVKGKEEKEKLSLSATKSAVINRFFDNTRDPKSTFTDLVAKIHAEIANNPQPRKGVPVVPDPIAQIPVQPPKNRQHRVAGGQQGKSSRNKLRMTLPMIKAEIGNAAQKLSRRGLKNLPTESFVGTGRLREVLQQKSVLESMLMQHKRLQRDKQNIALDLQRMRTDLDKIRFRLDTSMKALNSTYTIFDGDKKPTASHLNRKKATSKNVSNSILKKKSAAATPATQKKKSVKIQDNIRASSTSRNKKVVDTRAVGGTKYRNQETSTATDRKVPKRQPK